MVAPSLRIQSHKSRGYWPIEIIGHHGTHVKAWIVACEQLRAAVSATDVCVVVISGDFDFDVIARDALRSVSVRRTALCSDFVQVLDVGQIHLKK